MRTGCRMRRQNEGKDALLVPEKSLISVQGTYSVAVIAPDNKVHLHRVELGPSAQGQRVVNSGISDGDRIVIEGVQKVSEGALVNPVQAPAPSTQAPAPPTKP